MPLFRIEIKETWGSDDFSNDFKVEASDVHAALANGQSLATIIQSCQFDVVKGKRVLAAPIPDHDRTGFVEAPLTTNGARDSSGAKFAPFNTCAEVILATGTGSPGAKLIRGAIHASDLIVNGEQQELTGGSLTALQNTAAGIASFILANEGVIRVGKAARAATDATANHQAQMRQGDNKRRKKKVVAP